MHTLLLGLAPGGNKAGMEQVIFYMCCFYKKCFL